MGTHRAQIIEIHDLAPGVRSFLLEVDETKGPYRYLAGQWLDLHVEIQGQEKIGGYSIYPPPPRSLLPPPRSLSPPPRSLPPPPRSGSRRVCIAVKKSKHPVATYLHESVRQQDCVQISEGQGPCYFDPKRDAGIPLVLIAGGIGITPIYSIFGAACEAGQGARLLYSFRSSQCLFRDEIAELLNAAKNAEVTFRDTESESRIDLAFLRKLRLPQSAVFYLCGPQGMIDELDLGLRSLGYPSEQIRFEKWW